MFQRGPLPHAELVLLVDHHQAELGEADVFLQDGLRADDQVDPSGGDFFQHGGPQLGRHAAGQFRAADLAAGQEPPDREGMLPGEDFRGGHEHGLVSVGHGQQHRVQGHDRLAAAHVALQEAVHRPRPAHVGPDLGDRLPLALRSARRGRGGGCGRRSGPWPPAAGPAAGRAVDAA